MMPNGHSVMCRPWAQRLYSNRTSVWRRPVNWRSIWVCPTSGPHECQFWRVNQAWRTYHQTGYSCDCGTWIPMTAPVGLHLSYCPLSIPELRRISP